MTTENQKLDPYQRLKSIMNDGNDILTDKASDNLDKLLGIENEKRNGIFDKIADFFIKIDRKIFSSKSKMYNTKYSKRKRK